MVDTRYEGYQSATVELWGVDCGGHLGNVDCGGDLKIHNHVHNTDFCRREMAAQSGLTSSRSSVELATGR